MDTPRTDAVEMMPLYRHGASSDAMADIARTLERENADLRRQLEEANAKEQLALQAMRLADGNADRAQSALAEAQTSISLYQAGARELHDRLEARDLALANALKALDETRDVRDLAEKMRAEAQAKLAAMRPSEEAVKYANGFLDGSDPEGCECEVCTMAREILRISAVAQGKEP